MLVPATVETMVLPKEEEPLHIPLMCSTSFSPIIHSMTMHNAHASLPDAWALPDAHTSLGKQPKDVRAADVKEPAARKKTQGRPRGPKGWPDDILYLVSNDMSLSSLSAHDKRMVRPGASARIPGIEIRKITDPAHPAYGQNGLYATRDFGVGEVLGEYTGFVMPGHMGGEYTTRLWDTNDRLSYQKPGCDASKGGNEFRMINDFRGVPGAKGRNMRFSRCQVQGARAALIVAIKDVAEGEEFLLDYGEQYWGADSKPGPPQPGEPGYVAPPSAEDIARVEAELCEMLQQALED